MAFNLGDALRAVSNSGTDREQIEYIKLDLIDEDPNNFYQLTGIDELAANIELCGLQQPIRVRPISGTDRYMIVSGHRRRKAVELLSEGDSDRWRDVPCIVQINEVSPALQQLQLIYANANTRAMSSAELSVQAVQVEKLLYQLKEEGYEFPGRMRDHVAQAVNASKSKLARLKVIRDKLAFNWQSSWKNGRLSESVAYELAQLPAPWQDLIFDSCKDVRYLYAGNVQEYGRRFAEIQKTTCRNNVTCPHHKTMMELSCKDRWQDPCKNRCCWECPSLRSCKSSCKAAEGKKKDLKAAFKADADAEAQRVAERDKPILDTIRLVYERVGAARKAAGVSVSDLYAAQRKMYSETVDLEKQERLERGEAKLSTNTNLPFGYSFYASDAAALCRVADLLQCSTDYLLGRQSSECAAVPTMDTVWHTGNPQAYGTYAAYVKVTGAANPMLRELLWTGGEWLMFGQKISDDVTVQCWAERPDL